MTEILIIFILGVLCGGFLPMWVKKRKSGDARAYAEHGILELKAPNLLRASANKTARRREKNPKLINETVIEEKIITEK